MTIDAELKSSPIHGLGLFATHLIPKGTVVWRYTDRLDRRLTPEEVVALDERTKRFFDHFCYRSPQTGLFILLGDDYRFLNHSSAPNVAADGVDAFGEAIDVAARDIEPGEELTYDYGYFGEAVEKP